MREIFILCGSPRKTGCSAAIVRFLEGKLSQAGNIAVSNAFLTCGQQADVIQKITDADVLVLVLPVYENSVPGSVMRLFECLCEQKNQLVTRKRQLLAVTSSGFCALPANSCTLSTCRLFAQEAGFEWLGGISAVPGPLVDEKALTAEKGLCKRLARALTAAANSLARQIPIPPEAFRLLGRPLIAPAIYRLGAYFFHKKSEKSLGKTVYYARPLADS